jgi:glycosyltransferase involved in cell wall biosynthesis
VPPIPSVSVCFPAYNEEPTIAGVLEDAHTLLSTSGLDYEILICDDGSTDGTGAVVDAIVARHPNMRGLHHAGNLGIRETYEHLYREAAKEFVFLNSTDGQWDTTVLFELLPQTREWDVIIAARRHKHYPPVRAFISWGFNLIPGVLFGVQTHDAGAVKLVRREIIQRFALVSRSPFSEAERLIRAARAGYRITDRPTDTHARQWGQPGGARGSLVAEAFVDVWRVWRALRAEARQDGRAGKPVTGSSDANQR